MKKIFSNLSFAHGNLLKKCKTFAVQTAKPLIEKMSGIQYVWEIYDQVEFRGNIESFLGEVLQLLSIKPKFEERELERITSSGPVLVVANHPHGALDGIILGKLLLSVRKDVKFLANPILEKIPELRELFFFVDPNDDLESNMVNFGATRNALRWLKTGGLLALFPAGEVSNLTLKDRRVQDRAWNENIAKIVRATNATVVPIHISGRNSWLFQLLGLIHPALRTLILPREMILQYKSQIPIRIGKPIPYQRLPVELSNRDLTQYFRFRSDLLKKDISTFAQQKSKLSTKNQKKSTSHKMRIAPHEGTQLLANEVLELPDSQLLIRNDEFDVYFARANQMPHLLNEIGRLREKTFRRYGEGTGLCRDIDSFDQYYLHLFVWNRNSLEIVGAYRMGQTDVILDKFGVQGLYTRKLFHYDSKFVKSVHFGLELGRSFIRPKYQKTANVLPILFKAIGTFVSRNPRYRYLFGPVSISDYYSPFSKNLMVDFIHKYFCDHDLAEVVQGMQPFARTEFKHQKNVIRIEDYAKEMDDVTDLIADHETRFRDMPPLLRQYLEMGAKIVAFNVDQEFSNSLDGLIRLDLLNADQKIIESYMGSKEYNDYCYDNVLSNPREPRMISL